MIKIRRKHVKWIVLAVILALLVPLAVVGGISLWFLWSFQSPSLGFGLVQDCPGVSVVISGEVRDVNGQPIDGATVQLQQVSVDSDSDLQRTFTTDATGHFAAPDALHIFFCDELTFDIAAGGMGIYRGGYERLRITYSLADNYLELPARPIPVRIIATLVRKLDVTDEV